MPSCLATFCSSVLSRVSTVPRVSATSFSVSAFCISAPIWLYFLLIGDSNHATNCLSSSSVKRSSSIAPTVDGASLMARSRIRPPVSSTNFLMSVSMALMVASRFSGGTCCRAWLAPCISCVTGRCSRLRPRVSKPGCCSCSSLATSSFLAGLLLAAAGAGWAAGAAWASTFWAEAASSAAAARVFRD
nr:hypothetical protein [Paucibacter sp. M5-1]MCZ7881115.1 hypothetical protein [Paucibacter sp. M5-1]